MNREGISAAEFEAKCPDILDQVSVQQVEGIATTGRGKAVALLAPPPDEPAAIRQLHGFLAGSVTVPPEVDLTEPALDEPFAAEEGCYARELVAAPVR